MRVFAFHRNLWRKGTAAVLMVTLALPFVSCAPQKRRPASFMDIQPKERIVGITTTAGEEIDFDGRTAQISGKMLLARVRGQRFQIALDRVQRYWVVKDEHSVARTIGLTAAVVGITVGALFLIAIATKDSCPFVYSWDGKKYVFDGEPFGGAITRGLERDDYSPLDQLRQDDRGYRLLLTNEVNETQYVNVAELWSVEHPIGTRVAPDDAGALHSLRRLEPLVTAEDQEGTDLRQWLDATDRRIWEALPLSPLENQRQEIVLTFRKPAGVRQAKLVYNVATGLWGSNMIKEMLLLHGRQVGAWYAELDRKGKELENLLAWELREELYMLKLEVEEPSGWQTRAILFGGGPFIVKDRVAMIDISRASGDILNLRIRPPRGFWAFNSFAMDYSVDEPVVVAKLAPREAIDDVGNDVRAALLENDSDYYEMPRVGDRASLRFDVPPRTPDMARTMILHTRGYYRLHLPETGEPDIRVLEQLANEPGEAARFAAERYAIWKMAKPWRGEQRSW